MLRPVPARWALAFLGSLALIEGAAPSAPAQGLAADYERADKVRELAQGKVTRDRVVPHWFSSHDRFWYRIDTGDRGREFLVVDAVRGTRGPAFDHARLLEALGKAIEDPNPPGRLPFESIEVAADGKVRFEAAGKGWSFDPAADVLVEGEKPAKAADAEDPTAGRRGQGGGGFRPRQGTQRRGDSPDGKWAAFIKGHNVHLRDKAKGEEFPLSAEGTADDSYEAGFYWSPDSKKVVAMRVAKAPDRRVNLIESSPKDQLQPRLSHYDYPKPGDKLPTSKPHLFDVEGHKPIVVADTLFPNPWSLDELRWSADSTRFTFLYNQRGHQVLRVVAVDAGSGEATPLIDETSPTFVDYSNKTFLQFLDKTDEILWMSERDGWNHLYLLDARTGAVKNQVTKGEWLIRGVDRVDEEARQVWFRGNGHDPGRGSLLHALSPGSAWTGRNSSA